jgi:hypothetical protein
MNICYKITLTLTIALSLTNNVSAMLGGSPLGKDYRKDYDIPTQQKEIEKLPRKTLTHRKRKHSSISHKTHQQNESNTNDLHASLGK